MPDAVGGLWRLDVLPKPAQLGVFLSCPLASSAKSTCDEITMAC